MTDKLDLDDLERIARAAEDQYAVWLTVGLEAVRADLLADWQPEYVEYLLSVGPPTVMRLVRELRRCREALVFYAALRDQGDRARAALEPTQPGGAKGD